MPFRKKLLATSSRRPHEEDRLFLSSRKTASKFSRLFSYRFFERLPLILFFLAVPIYFSLSFEKTVAAPSLNVIAPSDLQIVDSATLTVGGEASEEATVTINGEDVLSDKNGRFEKPVYLKEGVNTLSITARRGAASATVERTVIYERK